MLRFGFLTSPAVKVMLFQASEENSDPTWETQKAMNRPKAPMVAVTGDAKEKSGRMVVTSRGVHRSEKLAAIAPALRPTKMPSTISAISDSVFAEVKVFWMILPSLMPRVLSQVRKTSSRMATTCCIERLIAYLLEMSIGLTIQSSAEMWGTSTPRYRA